MFIGDFAEFSDQLYFVGNFPYEKCQIPVSSQKHCRKTASEECAQKGLSWYDAKNIYVKKNLEIKGWCSDSVLFIC